MCRAVLWDMDGTLVDSSDAIQAAMAVALRTLGRTPPRPDELRPMIGTPIRAIFAQSGAPEASLDELVRQYRAAYDNKSVQVFPGVLALLAGLQRAGCAQGIVTTKGDALADRALLDVGLRSFIDVIVGDNGKRPLKPDPAPVLEACSRLQVEPRHAVLVGDTVHDEAAARQAGAHFIGVSWGYGQFPPGHGITIAQNATELTRFLDPLIGRL